MPKYEKWGNYRQQRATVTKMFNVYYKNNSSVIFMSWLSNRNSEPCHRFPIKIVILVLVHFAWIRSRSK